MYKKTQEAFVATYVILVHVRKYTDHASYCLKEIPLL